VSLLKYIWRNAARNKLRSLLTALSIGFSLALMTVLYGYLAMQDVWGAEAKKHNRVIVLNRQGFAGELPIAYVERVMRTDGVESATPFAWYGGIYKDDKTPFAQFGTDANQVFSVLSEYKIDPAQLEAWQKNRQGCVVDEIYAKDRGWVLGEKIPIKGSIYSYNLDLVMVGTFRAPQRNDSLYFHWKYLDEGLKNANQRSGNAGMIYAKAKSAAMIPSICESIDYQFASSDNPTRTQTEAAFFQMFADMLGNIQVYIRNISLAVMFSLTLVSGNAMAMAMRERTTEVAVLKAIGFSRPRVLLMILGETCLIALVGGVLGIAVGAGALQLVHRAVPQMFPLSFMELAGPWLIGILGVAVGIGFVSGIVPAVRAAQMSVVNGLRRV
jgi:putative ABC transport system permease protein